MPFSIGSNVEGLAGSEDLGIAITLIGVLAIPVATGVAMLRYRLYEVDRVISRTLVYGALTVILGAAYVGARARRAGRVLVRSPAAATWRSRSRRSSSRRSSCRCGRACSGSSTGASTAAATTPSARSSAFGARLREQVDLDGSAGDLARVVRETMQPAHASLWLAEAGQ